MRYLSVCSGIEAASAAWHPLGWTPVAFSEVDKFPSAVLAHHYPDVPNWGDMTKFKEWPDADVDVLVGGTPCQSFSVAGLRKGMDDPRGNLALTYLAIADRYKPTFLCWENVPGVLSSNGGRDFGAILGGMVKLGYGVAYRVLDAQFFGVPQRRRRVFVVGHLGDWRRAAAVLFEQHSLQGHPPPRRETGKGLAPKISARTKGGGGLGTDFDLNGELIHCADVAPTLNAHFGDKQGLENQHINGGGASSLPEISHCLNAGGMGRQDYETETLIPTRGGSFDVAHSLRGEGFDASEDGTGRGTPLVTAFYPTNRQPEFGNYEDVSPAIKIGSSGSSGNPPAIAFSAKDHGADAGDIAPTLRSMGHDGSHANGGGQVAIAFDTTQITSKANYSNPQPGDPSHPLAAGAHPPLIAFLGVDHGKLGNGAFKGARDLPDRPVPGVRQSQSRGASQERGLARSQTGEPGAPVPQLPHESAQSDKDLLDLHGAAQGAGLLREALPETEETRRPDEGHHVGEEAMHGAGLRSDGPCPRSVQQARPAGEAGDVGDGAENEAEVRFSPMAVRRLTPVECERLQGFPDDYTLIPWRGGMSPDGPRYKALGNSMAVPCMRFLGERIQMVSDLEVTP